MNRTVLVFSDSHGNERRMQNIIDAYNGDYDAVFFLGDGIYDAEKLKIPESKRLIAVTGNCDYRSHAPSAALFEVGGYIFFLCHGHEFGVKGSLAALEKRARAEGADAALFGHTHIPYESCVTDGGRPLYLFNPGSLSFPVRGGSSFGVITVTPGGLLFSHGDAEAYN